MSKLIDLTGKSFNDLTVLSRNGIDSTGKAAWLCRCKCGKTATITGLNLKSNNSKTCGCKKHLSGLDNPRTITDPVRLQEKKRALGTIKTWRKKVLKRDSCCVNCKASQQLHVHHIVGFADSLYLRTDLNNGITLCHKCHMDFHLKYGRRTGFTAANLNDWLVGVNEPSPIISTGTILFGDSINIIKYISRWKDKGGVEDLKKAQHYLQKLIETHDKERVV